MSKVILTILDGVGIRDEIDGNAFKQANKPTYDFLWNHYPHTTLDASGNSVGLPTLQMGNSETGHLNIGAGRIVYQPLELINESIRTKKLSKEEKIINLINRTKEENRKIHLVGLISDGGVHSHINHLKELLEICKENEIPKVYMHLITDGRDTLLDSGYSYVSEIEDMNIGKIATICGRFYTMDRDKNYDRTNVGYKLMTEGIGDSYSNSKDVFESNYRENIYDEFIKPSVLDKEGLIEENDSIIWFNFRPDRAIQILEKLQEITPNVITMMKVSDSVKAPFIFEIGNMKNILGDYLSLNNLKQLRIAETEKYAHVTYFFDGGVNKEITGCDKILIPSPKVPTYDLKPEMSAYLVTDKLIEVMDDYDVIILNFANGDMVGHTGNMSSTIKAIEHLDINLKRIYVKCMASDFTMIVTADHGNSEFMLDEEGNKITAHTTNKVPFIICKDNLELKEGKLADVAPTILELLNLDKPIDMTGESLIIK